jgi:phage shock protein E
MKTIKELLQDPSTKIVDVRSPGEFATEHVPGAENIPVERISAHAMELKSLNKEILLYCRSGARSGMATSILKQEGLENVYNGGSVYDLLFELQIK